MLPELGCFGRAGKQPSWGGINGGISSSPLTQPKKPSTKPTMSGAVVSRRTPVEHAFLRGGARDTTMASTRGFPTLDRMGSGGGRVNAAGRIAGSSRGALNSSVGGGVPRSSLTTPPSRPGVRRLVSPGGNGSGSSASVAAPAAAPPVASISGTTSGSSSLKCDKCDGKHATDQCPWFKKPRDKHPDAKPASEKKMLGLNSGPVEILRHARVIRQPGDGSCLYHSLSHGLRDGSSASTLRRQIAEVSQQRRAAAALGGAHRSRPIPCVAAGLPLPPRHSQS